MYARSPNRPRREHEIRIPEHYSGCAFLRDEERIFTEAQEENPEKAPALPLLPPPGKPPEQTRGGAAGECAERTEKPFALHAPFSSGMHFDELLILGLIFLLGRNEEDPEILLLLALLLLCG